MRKHGVSCDEAETAFSDEHALLLDDPEHSADDDRFILIGLSAALRMVVVCHCYHEGADVIRLISARLSRVGRRVPENGDDVQHRKARERSPQRCRRVRVLASRASGRMAIVRNVDRSGVAQHFSLSVIIGRPPAFTEEDAWFGSLVISIVATSFAS